MSKTRAVRTCLGVAVVLGVLAGPVAGASASRAGIRALIQSWNPKVLVSEGKVVSAVGEYKTSRNPAPVETAIGEAIGTLRGLRQGIEHQRAIRPRVKRAKDDLMDGLREVILAYERLEAAFREKGLSPAAADRNARRANALVQRGQRDLREGARLLG
ncbi:MAG TPA: hypothetical protein VGY13_08475 [Solirubrobacteraceae bacterium]|jgi:hypothetical protein|nr:hypothetical protein [Solirubrobacteraceae bacterium]